MDITLTTENAEQHWSLASAPLIQAYTDRQASFIANVMPAVLVNRRDREVLEILATRLGHELLRKALDWQQSIPSPLVQRKDTNWIKSANIVGINVRTIGHFWNVVKYALGLSAAQSTIHLLPIWEPGVVSSLYGMASWNINAAFFSRDLAILFPDLDTVEKQLKVVVNLLHALDKKVGMDVIPHTDRYAEIVLANPHFFEWLKRKDQQILDHRADLHIEVMQVIFELTRELGSADPQQSLPQDWSFFFSPQFDERKRLAALFGKTEDQGTRNERRERYVDRLFHRGLEPVPATMAPPYRGLEVDPDPQAVTIDDQGRAWRDYRISAPQEMSRVFGPLTRYKLYERKDDNSNWEIDFERPRAFVWDYVCQKYAAVAEALNLDFMRGDMSHVQMRPTGVPLQADLYYDLHRAIKLHIQQSKPYFAYFGESFLTPPNYMGYGDEIEHLELSGAEVTLGDLQSMVVGSTVYLQNLRRYVDIKDSTQLVPSLTMMTADKDDPRFDQFYWHGNVARFFMGLFTTDMPSYMGLGFTCRDRHIQPAPNEHYTKLYVFAIKEGPKATKGPFIWGANVSLFNQLNSIKRFADRIADNLAGQGTYWLLPPDPTGGSKVIAWTQKETPQFVFVCNLSPEIERSNLKIPHSASFQPSIQLQLVFSTIEHHPNLGQHLARSQRWSQLPLLAPGECQCLALRYEAI